MPITSRPDECHACEELRRERDEARAALTALQSYQVQYDDLQDENAKLQGERDEARAALRDIRQQVGYCLICKEVSCDSDCPCRAALEKV